MRGRRAAWIGMAVIAGLGALAWHAGVLPALDPDATAERLRASGTWGPAVFLLVFSLGNGLGAPGFLFLLPAIAVWPPPQALALVWLGAIGAGCVGFAFARGLGRDFVSRHLPRSLRHLDTHAGRRGVRIVILIRIAFFLAGPAHWALGLSSVTFRAQLVGSAVGFLGPAAFWTLAGGGVLEALREGRAVGWIALLGLIALGYGVQRWLRSRSREIGAGADLG